MKKIVRLTESQLYRLIRNTLNESINSNVLRYGSYAMLINSEEDVGTFLENLTGNFNSKWKEPLMNRIKMGDYVVPVGYPLWTYNIPCTHINDWAIINYFESFEPNNIYIEQTKRDTRRGFIWGDESFLNSNIDEAIGNYLSNIKDKLIQEELVRIKEKYGINFDKKTCIDFINDALFDIRDNKLNLLQSCGTGWLEEFLIKHGYLKKEERGLRWMI